MEERKILIVEDERKVADTLKFGLEEKGYYVEIAYDGNMGQRLFKSHSYDLIILDINLPGINGFDLCKIIRKENANIPIIMITSEAAKYNVVEAIQAGVTNYVVKPIKGDVLWQKLAPYVKPGGAA